ncbi:BrnT family toxin [Deinococcus sp. YIM 134068]|uniref:CopG family antitoxin n=1 Tax=Deinococcus lichenicola TaxID=3118910 RepID=UPI002F942101
MEFDWDDANEGHIARHGIDPEEAEEAATDPRRVAAPAYRVQGGERRQAVTGKTDGGRLLTVVLTRRGDLCRAAGLPEVDMSELTIITDMSQIPAFQSEDEEAEFWATHGLAEHLLDAGNADPDLLPPPRSRRSTPMSLRLGVDLERRLRQLAEVKGTPYQTLLKEFVLERVYEEEKRHQLL